MAWVLAPLEPHTRPVVNLFESHLILRGWAPISCVVILSFAMLMCIRATLSPPSLTITALAWLTMNREIVIDPECSVFGLCLCLFLYNCYTTYDASGQQSESPISLTT